jgi:hypothetical protein
LADADLNEPIVAGCLRKEPAMDFLSANEANLEGFPTLKCSRWPPARIAYSSRTIFQTMPRHFSDFLRIHGSSPPCLLAPQSLPSGEAIEELVLIWGASDATITADLPAEPEDSRNT